MGANYSLSQSQGQQPAAAAFAGVRNGDEIESDSRKSKIVPAKPMSTVVPCGGSEDVVSEDTIWALRREAAYEALAKSPLFQHLDHLKDFFQGAIINPRNDPMLYEEVRTRPYNMDCRGYPMLILQPHNAKAVSQVVTFIQTSYRDLPIPVPTICVGTGMHSGSCMLNDSIVIDLVGLDEVTFNEDHTLVIAGGGCAVETVDIACSSHNVVVPLGTFPGTGLAGLTLAGGVGWLSRLYGLAVDSLDEIEVVLADGRIVQARDESTEYRDLIWACRGGGGNFGIVTKFIFRTHTLPQRILGGFTNYLTPTYHAALTVYKNFDEAMNSEIPENIGTMAVFQAGALLRLGWVFYGLVPEQTSDSVSGAQDAQLSDSVEDFENAVKRLGGWLLVENTIRPITHARGVQRMTSPSFNYSKCGHSYTSVMQIGKASEPSLPDGCLSALLLHTRCKRAPSLKHASVLFTRLGGKVGRPSQPENTCISDATRNVRYFVVIEAQWHEEAGATGRAAARAWVEECRWILAPFQSASMLYAPDIFSNGTEIVAAYDETTLERLAAVKQRYDPGNFFRQNANISPHHHYHHHNPHQWPSRKVEELVAADVNNVHIDV